MYIKSLLNKNEYQSPAKKLPTDNTSFLNYVASDNDKHGTNTTNQAISYTSASRNIENFLEASKNSNSKYGLETFSVLSKVPAIPLESCIDLNFDAFFIISISCGVKKDPIRKF